MSTIKDILEKLKAFFAKLAHRSQAQEAQTIAKAGEEMVSKKESLVKYQELVRRIEAWEKKKAKWEEQLRQLSDSDQPMNADQLAEKEKLQKKIRDAEDLINEYENRKFEMEAKE